MRSLVTFATIEAAAIEKLFPSPPVIGDRGNEQIGQPVPVDEHETGRRAERLDGDLHRLEGSPEDIDAVDLAGFHDPDAVGEAALENAPVEPLALVFAHQLRIPHAAEGVAGLADDRGRDDGAGERPPPGFVHAGDETGRREPSLAVEPDQILECDPATGHHSSTLSILSAMRAALPLSSLR